MKQQQKLNRERGENERSFFVRTRERVIGVTLTAPLLPFIFLGAMCAGFYKSRRKS